MQVKIMQYGDLSSLVVEYPDYNSLGDELIEVASIEALSHRNSPTKVEYLLQQPLSVKSFADFSGRALIITTKSGDLVSYGIIGNEMQLRAPVQSAIEDI